VAAEKNTRGAAENDDPIKTGHSGNRRSKRGFHELLGRKDRQDRLSCRSIDD